MSPPQQKETAILENTIEEKQIDIKQLAAEGYYFEFPETKVIYNYAFIYIYAHIILIYCIVP